MTEEITNNKIPRLLTSREACEKLGLSKNTYGALCRSKDFPAFKISGKYYNLCEWIKQQSTRKSKVYSLFSKEWRGD